MEDFAPEMLRSFLPIIALSIPIVALVAGSVILVIALLFKYLRRRRLFKLFELYHRERMAAIEKGVEVPVLPEALLRDSDPARPRTPSGTLLKGLVWLFAGAGAFVALRGLTNGNEPLLTCVPMGIGMAYLVYYLAEGRKALPKPPTDLDAPTPLPATAKP
jgi:hypothetical protein